MKMLLERHGYEAVGKIRNGRVYMVRPGKEKKAGHSATLGFAGPGVLHVYTTSDSVFQANKSYSPMYIYTYLEHGGDWKAAQKALAAEGYGRVSTATPSHTSSHRVAPSTHETADDQHPPPPSDDTRETIIEMPQQPLPYSDQTNAETLVRWYGRDIRYCNELKQWLFWDGRRWAYDTTQHVMRLAKATIKRLAASAETLDDDAAKALLAHVKASLSASRLKAMVTLAESEPGVAIKPAELDRNPWLLNCRNGTVDLRTGILQAHQREDWLTKCLDTEYNPNATCPNWLAFLWRVMDGPTPDDAGHEVALLERHQRAEQLVQFLQRAVGYSLTGIIAKHILLFLYGGGQNGKSTLAHV
jgi:phage/plasmid-associated DNA primase